MFQHDCGMYEDEDFDSYSMCCACGGGNRTYVDDLNVWTYQSEHVLCRLNANDDPTCTNSPGKLSETQYNTTVTYGMRTRSVKDVQPSKCVIGGDAIHCYWRSHAGYAHDDDLPTWVEFLFTLSKWPLDFGDGAFATGTSCRSMAYALTMSLFLDT